VFNSVVAARVARGLTTPADGDVAMHFKPPPPAPPAGEGGDGDGCQGGGSNGNGSKGAATVVLTAPLFGSCAALPSAGAPRALEAEVLARFGVTPTPLVPSGHAASLTPY
jgi:hypothetical protein